MTSSAEVAVASASRGYYVPGGGLLVDESPDQAVEREAREECGLFLKCRSVLGSAVEIVYSSEENVCHEKRATFLDGHVFGITLSVEPMHKLVWFGPH